MPWRIDTGLNDVYEVNEPPDDKHIFDSKLHAFLALQRRLEEKLNLFERKLRKTRLSLFNIVYPPNPNKTNIA